MIAAIRLLGDNLYDFPANPSSPSLPKNSVVVCLAGGKHRIEAGYSLFAGGVGENLFIVGAGKHATALGLARIQAMGIAQKIPQDRFEKILVENESRNTIENAFVVKRFLDQNPNVKNLILVTSSYHMRRATFMVAHQIAADVNIIPFVPQAMELGRNNWWHTWLGITLTTEEYFKFLLTSLLVPRLGYF